MMCHCRLKPCRGIFQRLHLLLTMIWILLCHSKALKKLIPFIFIQILLCWELILVVMFFIWPLDFIIFLLILPISSEDCYYWLEICFFDFFITLRYFDFSFLHPLCLMIDFCSIFSRFWIYLVLFYYQLYYFSLDL